MNLIDEVEIKTATVDALLGLLQGNQEAVAFCVELLFVFHLWDDMIDGQPRDKRAYDEGFMIVLMRLRRNGFYRQFEHELLPLITSAILQWFDSNTLEANGDLKGLRKAYMLRAFIIQIWGYCAYLIGGVDYYREHGAEIQALYTEDFDAYAKEFLCLTSAQQ